MSRSPAKLDPNEQHFRTASAIGGLSLFLRYLPPAARQIDVSRTDASKIVLYVHGGSFPSALSIAHRFDGRSWRDELTDAGFHVWGLDFLGFGESDRYPEMQAPASDHAPLGRANEAWLQIAQAVNYIVQQQNVEHLSIVAHSWGTMPTCIFAIHHAQLIERLVLFAPITLRQPTTATNFTLPAYSFVSLPAQWKRFTEDVPANEPPVLLHRHFVEWGPTYLATDSTSQTRDPASVMIPSGPLADFAEAWQGKFAYDPTRINVPVAIIRGEWDSLCTDSDARWLFDALSHAPLKRDIKVSRATHLMHLEEGRFALYQEALAFLAGHDTALSVSSSSVSES